MGHGKGKIVLLLLKSCFPWRSGGDPLPWERGALPAAVPADVLQQLAAGCKTQVSCPRQDMMPCGTARLWLASHCAACSFSTALLNGVLRGVVLCIRGALKAGVILDEQFVLIPCLFQGASSGTGGSWLHLVLMAKQGEGLHH